jgi:hypothetical protein
MAVDVEAAKGTAITLEARNDFIAQDGVGNIAIGSACADLDQFHSGEDRRLLGGSDANDRCHGSGYSSASDGGDRGQGAGFGGGDALDEDFDSAAAAEGGAGIDDGAGGFLADVFFIRFVADDRGLGGLGDEHSGAAGDVALEASAADRAPGPAIGGDEHSRSGVAIGRALNGYDGRQRGGFPFAAQ